MKEKQNDDLKTFVRICMNTLILLVAAIMEFFLLEKYPMTGLGRIFFMPFTILICFGLMLITNQIAKSTRNWFIMIAIYIIMISLTIIICIGLWGQDGGPTTWEQIFDGKKREHYN